MGYFLCIQDIFIQGFCSTFNYTITLEFIKLLSLILQIILLSSCDCWEVKFMSHYKETLWLANYFM